MIRQGLVDGWRFRARHAGSDGEDLTEEVTVPHDAIIATDRQDDLELRATGYFAGGAWEYTRVIDAPEEWRERTVLLEFEAVYRSAAIYVNGDLVGHRPSGYATFSVCLDGYLRYGAANTIRVEARAHGDSRWYSGGGLIRPVWLIVADPVHIALDGVTVTTPDIDDQYAMIEIDTTLKNGDRLASTRRLHTRILGPGGDEVAADEIPVTILPGEDAIAHQRLLISHPERWSLDSPLLHRVESTLLADDRIRDTASTTFGIRHLTLDPMRGFRINGETVKLRGACVHHDNGIIGAATIDRAEHRRVEILKAAGFNAVRSAHQPMSRAMLDACDRLGVLVMDELTDIWTRTKNAFDDALTFPDWWRANLAAMVRKDRNHPSVFAYSIGNEIPEIGTGAGAVWMRRLATETRTLDPTRFVTSGVNGALLVMADEIDGHNEGLGDWAQAEVTEINDMMASLAERMNALGVSAAVTTLIAEPLAALDIAGLNYLDSRYSPDRVAFPHRVIVGSETFPTRIDELWSSVLANDHVIGDFTWTGMDYLGEPGIGRPHYADRGDADDENAGGALANYPWIASWAGDIDITGRRRPASYYREIVFGLRSAPYIAVRNPATRGRERRPAPWSWTDSSASWTWPGSEGAPIEIEVYSDADEVELFVSGVSAGTLPCGAAHRYRAVFAAVYEPGIIEAVARHSDQRCESTSLRTAETSRHLVITPERTQVAADGHDLVYLDIEIVDEHGTLAGDADDLLEIEVHGVGRLRGFGSAAPATRESYTDSRHHAFRGHALAVVQPVRSGRIDVTVRGEHLAAATTSVEVAAA